MRPGGPLRDSMEPIPQKIELPVLRWPPLTRLISLVAGLIAVVVLVIPSLTEERLAVRVTASASIVALAIAFPVLPFVAKGVAARWRRARAYESLLTYSEEVTAELEKSQALVTLLVKERNGYREFQLAECYSYEAAAYVKVRRKRGLSLSHGHLLVVVTRSGRNMGTLEIVETGPKEYLAKLRGDADPLWRGAIYDKGGAYCPPPPQAVAVLPNDEGNDND